MTARSPPQPGPAGHHLTSPRRRPQFVYPDRRSVSITGADLGQPAARAEETTDPDL